MLGIEFMLIEIVRQSLYTRDIQPTSKPQQICGHLRSGYDCSGDCIKPQNSESITTGLAGGYAFSQSVAWDRTSLLTKRVLSFFVSQVHLTSVSWGPVNSMQAMQRGCTQLPVFM